MRHLFTLLMVLILAGGLSAQSVSVNSTGDLPDTSAILDIQSSTKGVLIPRMTTIQRELISGPAIGLLVFDTDTGSFWFKETGGWVELRDGNITALADNNFDTKIQVEESPDEDIIRFDLAGTEHFRMEDSARFSILNSGGSVFIGRNAGKFDDLTTNRNVFIGEEAGASNTGGYYNTSVGSRSMLSNGTGNHNTAMGRDAMRNNTSGANNTAIGDRVFENNSTGTDNTALGKSALTTNASGNSNTAIGAYANVNVVNLTNATAIGANAVVSLSNSVVLGNNANVGIGTSAPLSLLHVSAGDLLVDRGAVNTNVTRSLTIGGARNASGTDYAKIDFLNVDSNSGNVDYTGARISSQNNTSVATGDLRFSTTGSALSEKMIITPNGNVGIGSSTPTSSLVVGDDLELTSFSSGNAYLTIGDGGAGDESVLVLGSSYGNYGRMLWKENSHDLSFDIFTDAFPNLGILFLKGNGRVGIKNTSPLYELHVGNGNISAINGSNTRMVVSDNDNAQRAAVLGLAKTSSGARVEAQLEANGSSTAGPSVIIGSVSNHPLYIRTGNITRMTLTTSGDLGIGTSSPSSRLEVAGDVTATCGVLTCSDARYKRIDAPLEKTLEALEHLQGIYFYWDRDGFPEKQFSEGRQIGVIAQELERYFPELVHTDQEGYKTVDYPKLSAVLIQGIKEQQTEIRDLNARMDLLEKRLNSAGL